MLITYKRESGDFMMEKLDRCQFEPVNNILTPCEKDWLHEPLDVISQEKYNIIAFL